MNPLLEIQFKVPFDQIRAEHVEPAIQQLLEEARKNQAELSSSTGPRTFDNTLLALEDLTEKLDWAMGVVKHLESVATYPELRAAYNAVQPDVSLFYTNIVLDPGIWRILKEYASTDEAKALTGPRARFLKKTMDGFRRSGADLDEAGKAKLQNIEVELSTVTTKFAENVLDSTNAFELVIADEKQLAGLPPSAVEAARESAKSKSLEGWRFTLQAPSYTAVITYMADREIREKMYRAYSTRASSGAFDNRAILLRILELRRAKAELLQYRDFADLVLEDRMAKNGERAYEFVRELHDRTKEFFDKENDSLRAFRRTLEGDDAPELQPWDVAYSPRSSAKHYMSSTKKRSVLISSWTRSRRECMSWFRASLAFRWKRSTACLDGIRPSGPTRSRIATGRSSDRFMPIGFPAKTSVGRSGWMR